MTGPDDDYTGAFVSPPDFMHEVVPAYAGTPDSDDPRRRTGVKRWRKAEPARLMQERLAIAAKTRRRHNTWIAEALETATGDGQGRTVSAYWPFRGEPNLHPLLKRLISRGARDVWNIPVPTADAETVVPDVVIAPVVGFDPDCYRLGYGGEFYDRTLAAMPGHPRVFGVGYTLAAVPTIYPQRHDIPMDAEVTEDGMVVPAPELRDGAA